MILFLLGLTAGVLLENRLSLVAKVTGLYRNGQG